MINLDYLCVAMIINIKAVLMESDYSMCLANLLNYPDHAPRENLLRYALKIKEKINNPQSKDTSDIIAPTMNYISQS